MFAFIWRVLTYPKRRYHRRQQRLLTLKWRAEFSLADPRKVRVTYWTDDPAKAVTFWTDDPIKALREAVRQSFTSQGS